MTASLVRPTHGGAGFVGSLARAAAAIARLDQVLDHHPLRPAFLYRARLEAVRRQADVDGQAIDPWHLAALLEGLRLRMEHELRIIDRGAIFEAGRHALHLHQWLTTPDIDQDAEVRQAGSVLAAQSRQATPLLAAAAGFHAWIEAGGTRPPMRAALVRFWEDHRLLCAPVPLTGAAALRAGTPWEQSAWAPVFLDALAEEAGDALRLLQEMERAWFAARGAVAGRRRNSRAAAAINILASAPLLSATSLAAGLDMAVKNTIALLDGFCAAGIAVEVTHRAKRRLFGLAGLAPLREGVAPPRRPEPGRGRGRPRILPDDEIPAPLPPVPGRPLTPPERRQFDYSDIETWMAHADQAIHHARRTLDALARGEVAPVAQQQPAAEDMASAANPVLWHWATRT